MESLTQVGLEQMCDAQPPLDGIYDSKDREAIEAVLNHKGFWLLYGLMLGARQAQFVALSLLPIGSMSEVARASVIQGTIKGIDLLRHTVVEQGIPAQEGNEGARQ